MALRLTTVGQINAYVRRATQIAAGRPILNVHTAIPLMAQILILRLNLPQDVFEVMERLGQARQACWVRIGGNRYFFTYVHATHVIELRDGSMQGQVLQTFNNHTPRGPFARSWVAFRRRVGEF